MSPLYDANNLLSSESGILCCASQVLHTDILGEGHPCASFPRSIISSSLTAAYMRSYGTFGWTSLPHRSLSLLQPTPSRPWTRPLGRKTLIPSLRRPMLSAHPHSQHRSCQIRSRPSYRRRRPHHSLRPSNHDSQHCPPSNRPVLLVDWMSFHGLPVRRWT